MLMVAMDANFRLKSRLRAAISKEPALGLGWTYFVDHGPYSEFIKDYVDEEEVCVAIILTSKLYANDSCRLEPVSGFRHF